MERRFSSSHAHSLFILPETEAARTSHLTLLILADGNRRSRGGGGYAGGGRKVVAIAEHLARRPDVSAMVACILSPDNIAKRSDGFFLSLYKEFIRLGVEIDQRGALVRAGVRMELPRDLAPLRERGGPAAALADAMEAAAELTARVIRPDLRLVLGVGYGPETVRELDADIVLRTGMEETGVLRLSGLHAGDGALACATTTMWPDIEPREIDEVVERAKQRAAPGFSKGYDAAAITSLVHALSRTDIESPVIVTIPSAVAPPVLATMLAELGERAGVRAQHGPKRYGRPSGAAHEIRILDGRRAGGPRGLEGGFLSVLAPGQASHSLTLPGWLALGNANVHACDAGGEGIVNGIRRALRFSAAHPALLGGDRPMAAAPAAIEPAGSARGERDEIADRFVEKSLAWAQTVGLMLPGTEFRTAAVSYVLTAFFMHFALPTEWDETGRDWESRADVSAKYMMLVAVGDDGIFDWTPEGERREDRWARLAACSRYLQSTLAGDVPLPRVPRAEILVAIANQWRALFDAHRGTCHPAAAACFRAGLQGHYAGSLSEQGAGGLTGEADALAALAAGEAPAELAGIVEERFAGAPPVVAARARELFSRAREHGDASLAIELRALVYLREAGAAIAAGHLFRTAALAAPWHVVTDRAIIDLDAAATLVDYHFRLANDLSTFLESPRGDRDPKRNACTVLVPADASGPARAAAMVRALGACTRLSAWLADEVAHHLDRVSAVWPSMGVVMRRAVFVGRRVYEVGHYTTLPRSGMSAIFDEAAGDPRMQAPAAGR